MNDHDKFLDAVKAGQIQSVSEMLDRQPFLVDAKSDEGTSAVLLAMYYRQREMSDLLILRGARLDIYEACAAGKLARVQELLDQDLDLVNTYAQDGFQPLGLACFFGYFDIVNALLSRGAQVNSPSRNTQRITPLHSASAANSLPIMTMLIEHGAQVDARQAGEFTPLHETANHGNIEAMKLLLDHKADVNARDAQGRTALRIAREAKQESAVQFLQEMGGVE